MKQGWRKVIIFTEALAGFCTLIIVTRPTDPGTIYAMGFSIIGLIGAAIYGNVQEYKNKLNQVENKPTA